MREEIIFSLNIDYARYNIFHFIPSVLLFSRITTFISHKILSCEVRAISYISEFLFGISFFLFGMHTLSGALESVAGNRAERVIKQVAKHPIAGLLCGTLVTAVIQSSSATSVILVGLVSSGVMEFADTVYIIFGANIGTTITAWILSLSGIESTNPFVLLLKPKNFSPYLAIIGIILLLFSKRQRKVKAGVALVGFALLIHGMELMTSAVSPLADSPEFASFLVRFSSPVFCIVAGTFVTALLQSSSASVGILQAFSVSAVIPYSIAIPIIMGQNIGTCITAVISAIGAGKEAKKVAKAHTMINVLGTAVWIIPSFFLGDSILNARATPEGIAFCHTLFNLLVTLVLMPFAKKLLR